MNILPMLILLAGLAFGFFLIAKNWSADMSIEGELKGIKNEVTAMRDELAALGAPVDLGPINSRLDALESAMALAATATGVSALADRLTTLEQLVGTPADAAEDPDPAPAPAPEPLPVPEPAPEPEPLPVDAASGDAGATG